VDIGLDGGDAGEFDNFTMSDDTFFEFVPNIMNRFIIINGLDTVEIIGKEVTIN
jgi:hypothetical protein